MASVCECLLFDFALCSDVECSAELNKKIISSSVLLDIYYIFGLNFIGEIEIQQLMKSQEFTINL